MSNYIINDYGCTSVNSTVGERIAVPVAILAALLLKRHERMEPHHASALREVLGGRNDDELMVVVRTGIIGLHK